MSASAELAVPFDARPEADPTCFVFGGVAFEICPAPGVSWSVGEEHRLFGAAYSTSPVAGRVHCVVSPAPELEPARRADAPPVGVGFRAVRWAWQGDVAHVSTARARAELRRLGPGCYAASALVVPSDAGCSALVTALTGAVVSREGGLVLHAAGVELDGRASLFIGPSGAGKTTAANHCPGARWMARDRAAVYPTRLGWYAAGMAGGDPIELPRASARVLPLASVSRIRRATERASLRTASAAEAVRYLRESLQTSEGSPEEESAHLDRVVALHAALPLTVLETRLGERLTSLLEGLSDVPRASRSKAR